MKTKMFFFIFTASLSLAVSARVVFDTKPSGNSNPCGAGEVRPPGDCSPIPKSDEVCCMWVNGGKGRFEAIKIKPEKPIKRLTPIRED
jgi:hypothetical protein